jgi:hypothetical protein
VTRHLRVIVWEDQRAFKIILIMGYEVCSLRKSSEILVIACMLITSIANVIRSHCGTFQVSSPPCALAPQSLRQIRNEISPT